MTTIDTRPEAAAAVADDAARTTGDGATNGSFFAGVAAWFTTTDHKRIGRLYAGSGLIALVAAAVVGLILGLERADDANSVVDAGSLLQLFQAYRVGLVFGAIVPLGLGLAIAVTPLQLGARAIAFPRLALTGFYAWLGGFTLAMVALGRNGGIGGGDDKAVEMFLVAHGLMIIGLLASAVAVATSVLTTRAPGMTMRRVPLFAWSSLIASLGMLIALPVALGAIVYLYLDQHYGQLNFGGSVGIAPWLAWIFSVPAIIVYSLPAVGVAAELIPVTFKARQAMRGVAFAGIALVGVAALAATTQQFGFAIDLDTNQTFEEFTKALAPYLIFAGLPLLGIVIVMALGGLTATHGRGMSLTSAFVFSFLGLGMVFVGVVGNAMLGIVDLELRGTSFEESVVLYIVYGTVLAVMGGLAFWAPKLWGRVLPQGAAIGLALLGAGATILAALPLAIAGFLEQPGGFPTSDAEVGSLLAIDGVESGQLWMILSLVGHGLMALTVLAFIGLLFAAFGDDAQRDHGVDDNPFHAHTIEWATTSPAPTHNFAEVFVVESPQPLFTRATQPDDTNDTNDDGGSS